MIRVHTQKQIQPADRRSDVFFERSVSDEQILKIAGKLSHESARFNNEPHKNSAISFDSKLTGYTADVFLNSAGNSLVQGLSTAVREERESISYRFKPVHFNASIKFEHGSEPLKKILALEPTACIRYLMDFAARSYNQTVAQVAIENLISRHEIPTRQHILATIQNNINQFGPSTQHLLGEWLPNATLRLIPAQKQKELF